ncbi:hypothetical protein WBZ18_16680 [Clostridium botulinum]|uniref:Glycerone kinase n=1 Tax=Clostridium botulinum (strain 657 / Type Ba4) TaxID=515621 RepID=A0A3F3ADL8_CLOB6
MERVNKETLICIFKEIKNKMTDKKEELLNLDSEIGDGDLGITMSEGF